MMPQLDGWQVCREIRKKSQCPIIMLTAKGEVFDKVLGLELGADDYVVKPFEAKEVIARVKACLLYTSICGRLVFSNFLRKYTIKILLGKTIYHKEPPTLLSDSL